MNKEEMQERIKQLESDVRTKSKQVLINQIRANSMERQFIVSQAKQSGLYEELQGEGYFGKPQPKAKVKNVKKGA